MVHCERCFQFYNTCICWFTSPTFQPIYYWKFSKSISKLFSIWSKDDIIDLDRKVFLCGISNNRHFSFCNFFLSLKNLFNLNSKRCRRFLIAYNINFLVFRADSINFYISKIEMLRIDFVEKTTWFMQFPKCLAQFGAHNINNHCAKLICDDRKNTVRVVTF